MPHCDTAHYVGNDLISWYATKKDVLKNLRGIRHHNNENFPPALALALSQREREKQEKRVKGTGFLTHSTLIEADFTLKFFVKTA